MTTPLRTLIVDDEPLAIERLQILCAREPGVDLVGTANDGEQALRLVDALAPELLLLDIAMPGLDGLGVARALSGMTARPAIIFCTAFDSFAIEAFDVAAVDYLLKPVAPDRLARAVARAAAILRAPRSIPAPAPPQPAPAAPAWTEEFWVPHRSEVIRVAAQDIERIDAERDYMRLHVGARSFLLHQTISELERRLDPDRFVRLHRSTIVRRDRIAKLRHDGLGSWNAELQDGGEVRVGRTYLPAVRALMGR
ncbi:MAG: LytTR family DNA-binding domain-containing protein [Sphingomonas sp.]